MERGDRTDGVTYCRDVRAWRIDVLWAVGSAAVAFVITAILLPPGVKPGVSVLMAILVGSVVIGVRRLPVLAFVGLAVAALAQKPPPPGPIALCMLILLGAIAYRHSWQTAGIAWVITFVAVVAWSGSIHGPWSPETVLPLLIQAAVAAAPIAFGRYLRGVRAARAVARERVVEAETLQSVETRAARLAERSRLARDLHDIVAHHVGAMTLRASSGRLALDTSGDATVAADALSDIADTGRHVLDELRGLLTVLRDPDAIDEEALVIEPKAAIADAVARVRGAGLPVTTDIDPALARASLLVRTTVARIVQEALTNVLKHAGPGTETRLTARIEPPHTLRLQIDNDASAASPAVPATLPISGHGLAGMRDRVGLLGGALTAGPTAERGWSVRVVLPAPPAIPPAEASLPVAIDPVVIEEGAA